MLERNLDFDTVTDRRNTHSLKYDFAGSRGKPEGVLPLWVADMDFKAPSCVQDALGRQAEHGIWGYSETGEEYLRAVQSWMWRHHGWRVEPEWLVKTPGVVYALAMAVQAFTEQGDGVLVQSPVYYPFREIILKNKRRVVDNTLVQDRAGQYHMDLADFEKKVREDNIRLFFLCNPQNPVGRVWSREELEQIGDICRIYGVLVASDEIHSDFVFRGKHQVFANLKQEYGPMTITCTSPSKTFNLAGLQISNIFIENRDLRRRFRERVEASGYSQLNGAGIVACQAAYEGGEVWHQAVCAYIKD